SVEVDFEGLVDPAIEAFATEDELRKISTDRWVWGTRHSGYKLESDIADQLEKLVVGRTPVELDLNDGEARRLNSGIAKGSQNHEAQRLLFIIQEARATHR